MKFKKPKFWDFKKPNLIAYLLFPFTFLISLKLIIFFKNKNQKKKFKIKTICVGNIYIGWNWKNTYDNKIYELLKKLNFKVSTAKKFYVFTI